MGKNISKSYGSATELTELLHAWAYIKSCSTLHHGA
jgi:hypothetical protein